MQINNKGKKINHKYFYVSTQRIQLDVIDVIRKFNILEQNTVKMSSIYNFNLNNCINSVTQ